MSTFLIIKQVIIGGFILCFLVKIALQMHLDWKHKRFKGFKPVGFQPIDYLLKYEGKVDTLYEKKICNTFYYITICLLIATLTINLSIYLVNDFFEYG